MEVALDGWLFYDPRLRDDTAKTTEKSLKHKAAHERRLICASCGHLIARETDRTNVNGSHMHTCTNPHGITFAIGCFSDAKGCKPVGPSTDEFTWFGGYSWTVAVCRNCDVHLGWLFRSVTDRFFGLILDRLAARDS